MVERAAGGIVGEPGKRSKWAGLSAAVLCLNIPFGESFAVHGPMVAAASTRSQQHHHASPAWGAVGGTSARPAASMMLDAAVSSFLGRRVGCIAADEEASGEMRARGGGGGGGGGGWGEQAQLDGSLLGMAMTASSGASRHNPRGVSRGARKSAGSQGGKIFGKTGFGFLEDTAAPTSSKTDKGKDAAVTLKAVGLVPDVLPQAFVDTARLEVTYAKWVRSAVDLRNPFSFGDTPTRGAGKIQNGATITPTQTQDQPTIAFQAEPGALYSIVMTDPDVPSRRNPSRGEFVHWLRVNIPGDGEGSDDGDGEGGGSRNQKMTRVVIPGGGELAAGGGGGVEGGGEDVYSYVGAGPPPNTGLHRYLFLVYRQAGKIEVGDSDRVGMTSIGRAGFKTHGYAESRGLGQPVGWCMFEAEYDSYCDELYARLRGGK